MEYIDRARKAQQIFEKCNQEQVDEAVRVVGKAVYDHGEELLCMAVDETGMGSTNKVMKNKGRPWRCGTS